MKYRQERKIEKYLIERVKNIGGLTIKISAPGMAGLPDRLVLYKGRVYFIELKAPNGVLSPRQQAIRRLLDKHDFGVWVLYNTAEVDGFIRFIKMVIENAAVYPT